MEHLTFSNSKEITTVKEVWIPGLNYQTLETVFHRLSKHLEFRQKYSAARRIFNSLLGVWIS